jgi:hypothetical protein
MTWSELHALARETVAKAMKGEDIKPEAVQYALEILRIGLQNAPTVASAPLRMQGGRWIGAGSDQGEQSNG